MALGADLLLLWFSKTSLEFYGENREVRAESYENSIAPATKLNHSRGE